MGLYRSMEDGWCENKECLYYHPTGEEDLELDEEDTKSEKKSSGMKIKTKTRGLRIKSNPYPHYPHTGGWPGGHKP